MGLVRAYGYYAGYKAIITIIVGILAILLSFVILFVAEENAFIGFIVIFGFGLLAFIIGIIWWKIAKRMRNRY